MLEDHKARELFATAIQWVIDEARDKTENPDTYYTPRTPGNPFHLQSLWGHGVLGEQGLVGIIRDQDGADVDRKEVTEVCATACCVAGNIILAHGDRMIVTRDYANKRAANGATEADASWCIDSDGVIHGIPARAQELVGLSPWEEEELFQADSDVEEIVRIAGEVAGKRGWDLDLKF